MRRPRSHADRRAPLGTRAGARPRSKRGWTGAEETPLTIRARGVPIPDATRDYVKSRAGFQLGRYARSIEHVMVRFDPVRGATGSTPPIRCRIRVVVSRLQSIIAEATSRTARQAFGDALTASARWVKHLQERRVRKRRRAAVRPVK